MPILLTATTVLNVVFSKSPLLNACACSCHVTPQLADVLAVAVSCAQRNFARTVRPSQDCGICSENCAYSVASGAKSSVGSMTLLASSRDPNAAPLVVCNTMAEAGT